MMFYRLLIGSVFVVGNLTVNEYILADLYTTAAMSIEWKVDSADEIFLAEAIVGADSEPIQFRPLKALKGNRDLESFPAGTIQQCLLVDLFRPGAFAKLDGVGTQWLLFVRGSGKNARVSGAVNLTYPTHAWATAAITAFAKADQRVLKDADAIMAFVQQRTAEHHTIPIDCDADLTDELVITRSNNRLPIASRIGGKLLAVNIELWDEANELGQDHDTLVTSLLVPSDVPESAADDHRIIRVLDERYLSIPSIYFERVRAIDPPPLKPSRYLGTWRAEWEDRFMTIAMGPRGTLLTLIEPKENFVGESLPEPDGVGLGAGIWRGSDTKLDLNLTHSISGWSRHPGWSWNQWPVDLLDEKVAKFSEDSFRLIDGTEFVRQSNMLTVHDFPHEHPWYRRSKGWGKDFETLVVDVSYRPFEMAPFAPLGDLVLIWDERHSPPPTPNIDAYRGQTVKTMLGDGRFVPRVSVARVGDTLDVLAIDGERSVLDHIVNVACVANSPPGLMLPAADSLKNRSCFRKPEPGLIPMTCNIHDDEVGYLVVQDHGWVSVTDADGVARLRQWPIGDQVVRLTHPDLDLRNATMTVNRQIVENNRSRIELPIESNQLDILITGGVPVD